MPTNPDLANNLCPPSMQYKRFSLAAVFWNSVDLTAVSEPWSRACLGLDKNGHFIALRTFFLNHENQRLVLWV